MSTAKGRLSTSDQSSDQGKQRQPEYMGRVLLVDDDETIRAIYGDTLGRQGFGVDEAANLHEMMDSLNSHSYEAILLDLELGSEQGLDGLPYVLKNAPLTRVYILTAHGSIERAVSTMQKGAAGFFSKAKDVEKNVEELRNDLARRGDLQGARKEVWTDDLGLIGRGGAMQDLYRRIEQVKNVDSTVLIVGESGTGKELIARAIHNLSPRSRGRFEAINCAAIPETLLESELFGHKRGAFTDAKNDRKGIFELCSEGTLLLDEIGDMPLPLQAKMLRVLQEREVTPIGASHPVKINTRILAATHRDLGDEVKCGRFREDLYFRLSVVGVKAPPLRHRGDDIPLLVQNFIDRFNERFDRQVRHPAAQAMSRLRAYDWPGNVRELLNSVERAVILSPDGEFHLEHVFEHLHGQDSYSTNPTDEATSLMGSAGTGNGSATASVIEDKAFTLPLTQARQYFEKCYLQNILKDTNGNISEAARRAGRHRADLYRIMDKYGIDLDAFR